MITMTALGVKRRMSRICGLPCSIVFPVGRSCPKRISSSLVSLYPPIAHCINSQRKGGTTETQGEFLEILASDAAIKRSQDRYRKKPPTANDFALGYTYQDILDADHEGTRPLSRRVFVDLLTVPQICSPVCRSTLSPSLHPLLPPSSSLYSPLEPYPRRWQSYF